MSKQLLIEELLKFWDSAKSTKEAIQPSNCDDNKMLLDESMIIAKIHHHQNKRKMSFTEANLIQHLQNQKLAESETSSFIEGSKSQHIEDDKNGVPCNHNGLINEERKCSDYQKEFEDNSLEYPRLSLDPEPFLEYQEKPLEYPESSFEYHDELQFQGDWELNEENSKKLEQESFTEEENGVLEGFRTLEETYALLNNESQDVVLNRPDVIRSALSKVNDSLNDWHFISEIASTDDECSEEYSDRNHRLFKNLNNDNADNHHGLSKHFTNIMSSTVEDHGLSNNIKNVMNVNGKDHGLPPKKDNNMITDVEDSHESSNDLSNIMNGSVEDYGLFENLDNVMNVNVEDPGLSRNLDNVMNVTVKDLELSRNGDNGNLNVEDLGLLTNLSIDKEITAKDQLDHAQVLENKMFSYILSLTEAIQKMALYVLGLIQEKVENFHQQCIPSIGSDEGSLPNRIMLGLFLTTGLSMLGLLATILFLLQQFV